MQTPVTILTGEPIVETIAGMKLEEPGILKMAEWVKSRRPDCVPSSGFNGVFDLLPHGREEDVIGYTGVSDLLGALGKRDLSDNELLIEIAGRKCYDSFAEKAGRKSNRDYIEHTQGGEVPHASIIYHAKISLFIAGVSRRVSHELIRNYVGADRDEEGSPSQESTRFTHHYGYFIAPPKILDNPIELEQFRVEMQRGYDAYTGFIEREFSRYATVNAGKKPVGLDRKRIYEAAAGYLPQQAETSWIWTSNPLALAKMVREREHESADLEFRRLACKIRRTVVPKAPNAFPQPWMSNLDPSR